MSTVKIDIDGSKINEQLRARFTDLIQPKGELFREVALDLIPMIHERIHVDGKAADGSQIGTYSNEYMKVRTGIFGNAGRFKKGKNVGKNKNAGTHTKGGNKGAARPQHHRSGDTKVILSLTRQMENDYAVVAGEVGWGIGFNNSHNADKARWNDERYGHKVYDLTKEELAFAVARTEKLIEKNLNQ